MRMVAQREIVDFGYPCPTDAENACMANILQALYKVHRAEV